MTAIGHLPWFAESGPLGSVPVSYASAPCLATFVAATRSATKREQTLALEQGFQAAQQPLQRALVVRQHGQTRRTTLRGAYRVLQKAIDHGSQFVGIDYFPQCTGVA